jgi:hypothetical protein
MILTATNPFLLWFGSQARGYTLAVWLTLLSLYWFFRMLKEGSRRSKIWYAGVTAVALYLHPWVALTIASQFIIWGLAVQTKQASWRSGESFCWLGILSVPWAVLTLYQIRLPLSNWITPVDWTVLAESLGYLSYKMGWMYGTMVLLALLDRLRRWYVTDEFSTDRETLFKWTSLALAGTVPMILAVMISSWRPIYVPGRYEVIVLPAWLLWLTYTWTGWRWRLAEPILAMALIAGAWQTVRADREIAASYRETDASMAAKIINLARKNDVIATTDLSFATVRYYFDQQEKKNTLVFRALPQEITRHPGWLDRQITKEAQEKLGEEATRAREEIEELQPTRVWLFYKQGAYGDAVLEAWRETWQIERLELPEQPRAPSWFDAVVVFKVR